MNVWETKAKRIEEQFGPRIEGATANSIVPPHRVAGFIGVECAYDPHNGKFGEGVPRFEAAHYRALVSLRDHGFYLDKKGRKHDNFSHVTQDQVKTASDGDLRSLASSWGPAQIMGWHVINDLNCSVADLKDPSQSLKHVVDLLVLVAKPYIRRNDWPSVLRIWNTGTPDGETAHESYVSDAQKIADYYKILVSVPKERPTFTPPSLQDLTPVVQPDSGNRPLPEAIPEVTPVDVAAAQPGVPAPTTVEAAQQTNAENPHGLVANPMSLIKKAALAIAAEFSVPNFFDWVGRWTGLDPQAQKLISVSIAVTIGVLALLWCVEHLMKMNIWSRPDRNNVKQ